jgi:chemotaxis methyl-accepting protein methylase
MDAAQGVGSFDLILCRHVLGSLLPQARDRVIANLSGALRPGGRLVLGVSETLSAASGLAPVAGAPGVFEVAAPIRAAA